ncbi:MULTISPECIES: hypothetical protein [Mycolicibacterium]|uniref:SRPBCC family protein n=2 Tax=Mycolicibacterium TaxID=1866885 RepID=A0A378T7K9_9MYCO|nr:MULTISPECIES: hypothetical protein [Mycolicibacterium]BBY88663.1 hypothetical protein MTOK_44450 [Mycolicibacterium tokaiense]GFG60019.1 hypothetical protein MMUR_41550 [Mycolicibacterium murale]STZ56812.1 Uncharacterised protein [Mycolicibacterium tokaiense]
MTCPVLYPMRTVDSAVVRHTHAPHLRRRITIDHRPLPGITPAMLLDWFTHLGETMTYNGVTTARYLAWHPVDHIAWELARAARGGGAAEGARFRIVEQFGSDRYAVDVTDRVEKLDETGIRLVQRVAGVPILQLEHTWSAGTEGTHYVSVLDIGARAALLTPLNYLLTRRFPDAMTRAWVKHNIEEVGRLEFLLPGLE